MDIFITAVVSFLFGGWFFSMITRHPSEDEMVRRIKQIRIDRALAKRTAAEVDEELRT